MFISRYIVVGGETLEWNPDQSDLHSRDPAPTDKNFRRSCGPPLLAFGWGIQAKDAPHPAFEQGLGQESAQPDDPGRLLADPVAQPRRRTVDNAENALGHDYCVRGCPDSLRPDLRDPAAPWVVVRDGPRRRLGILGQPGLDIPWLHERHVDDEGLDLVTQRLGVPLQSELAGRVESAERHGGQPDGRADVD